MEINVEGLNEVVENAEKRAEEANKHAAEVAALVDEFREECEGAYADKALLACALTAKVDICTALAKFVESVAVELGAKATVAAVEELLDMLLETAGLSQIGYDEDMKAAAIAGAKVWTAEHDVQKESVAGRWCVQHPPGKRMFRGEETENYAIASLMLDLLNEKEKPKEPEKKTFYVVARMSHDGYAVEYYRNIADYVSFEQFSWGSVDEYINRASRDFVSVTQNATLFEYKGVAIQIAECLQNRADKLPAGDTVLYAVTPVNK